MGDGGKVKIGEAKAKIIKLKIPIGRTGARNQQGVGLEGNLLAVTKREKVQMAKFGEGSEGSAKGGFP